MITSNDWISVKTVWFCYQMLVSSDLLGVPSHSMFSASHILYTVNIHQELVSGWLPPHS